jgi:hypothetical protein
MSTSNERNPSRPGPRSPARFGPNAIIREAPASEDGHLLPLFSQQTGSAVAERRQSTRFRAAERHAWIGWWACSERFETVAAHLDNISQGGAKLVLAKPPPVQQIVWLCVGVPDPAECVQAKVLEVRPEPGGDSAIRLAFGLPCPHNLYRVAISGLAAARASASGE